MHLFKLECLGVKKDSGFVRIAGLVNTLSFHTEYA